jgi:glutamate synthase (ferredoxin)
MKENIRHWKACKLDLGRLLYQPYADADVGRRHLVPQNHMLGDSLGMKKLLRMCNPALEKKSLFARS